MDAMSDPLIERVTLMKASRLGYTKMLDHLIGYYVHQDPSSMIVVQPRIEDAKDYSRGEVLSMLMETPVLSELFDNAKSRDPDQLIQKRVFGNGASVAFIGANSPAGFRRITARIIAFDEVDGYEEEAGDEGDQISLGINRTLTFWNRKIVIGSTPTLKETSRIEKSFLSSDRRHYHVPCPHCGHMQVLKWSNLHWHKDADGNHEPESAHFVCEASGCVIEERYKFTMLQGGKWIAEAPFYGHAGFHVWTAYSLFPKARWAEIVKAFLDAKDDPLRLRTFANTFLGETWEEPYEKVEAAAISTRSESYTPRSIPCEVQFITTGVDVHPDRLEVQHIGWGNKEESWVVDYQILRGDTSQSDVWSDLDTELLRQFIREDGHILPVRASCLDTGGGHQVNQIHSFCRARVGRRVWAIVGVGGPKPIWPKRVSQLKDHKQIYAIGVDTAKDTLYGRLRIIDPGPGYVHFSAHCCDEEYFQQLTSERVIKRMRLGRPYRVWELPSGSRNECLDTFVYAIAARMSLPDAQRESSGLPWAVVRPDRSLGGGVVPAPHAIDATEYKRNQSRERSSFASKLAR